MVPDKAMRIVFLGSPDVVIELLKNLIENVAAQGHEIVGVISQPAKKLGRKGILTDPPVANYAKEAGLVVLQPENAKDLSFVEEFKELRPDLAITAAYGQILNDEFLKVPTRGTINIHPSLLPHYRGATPVQSSLLAGDQKTGVSILFTVKKMDAGNIISQHEASIGPHETTDDLLPRLFKLGSDHLFDAISKLSDPSFGGMAQDEEAITHCTKFAKEDGLVNWQDDAQTTINKFRAYTPWPGIFCFAGDQRVQITGITLADTEKTLKAGELAFEKSTKSLFCGTGSGVVLLNQVKPAGKKPQDGVSFWNGLKNKSILRLSHEAT
jgi:methionyl-tRNA formyltransferase